MFYTGLENTLLKINPKYHSRPEISYPVLQTVTFVRMIFRTRVHNNIFSSMVESYAGGVMRKPFAVRAIKIICSK